MKWKHLPRYLPFVRGIHRSPVNSPHKGQWRGALMFSLICVWIKDWVNNRETGDLGRHRAHYDVIVMVFHIFVMHRLTRWCHICDFELSHFGSKYVLTPVWHQANKLTSHEMINLSLCEIWIKLVKRKCTQNCLRNVDHFTQASMCYRNLTLH